MVQKVAGGHNCWLSSPQACADILTTWITNWAGGGTGSAVGTQMPLTAPPVAERSVDQDVSRRSDAVQQHGLSGGASNGARAAIPTPRPAPQSPYFASSNLALAYSYAQPEINLNTTEQFDLLHPPGAAVAQLLG